MERAPSSRRRRWLSGAVLVLISAVVVSSAYLVYMIQWTTHQEDLERRNQELAFEQQELERNFRRHLEEYQDFLETIGFAKKSEFYEPAGAFEAELKRELEAVNVALTPPLPPETLNFRALVVEALRQKRATEEEVRLLRKEIEVIQARHEAELKDTQLQAMIHLNQIDRLKERIKELGGD